MRWAALIGVLVYAAPLSAQAPGPMVLYTEDAWAVTYCVTRPVIWYSDEMPETERWMVKAHETSHVDDMVRFGGCTEFWWWLNTVPPARLLVEAKAFCAGAKHNARMHRASLMSAVWQQARVFVNYELGWDVSDAATAIYRQCGRAK